MRQKGDLNKVNWENTIGFWICLVISVGLFVGGFLVPPLGVIDGSVLKAGGILFGFGALAQAPMLIRSLSTAKITKGDMSIELAKDPHHHNGCSE